MIEAMPPSSDQTARHLQRLAALVAQRRAQLKLKMEDAAKACGVAYMTYWKIENGQSVRESTYSKVEVAYDMRAGACRAVLGGADSITLNDGTELIEGGQIVRVDPEALSEEIGDAVAKSVMLVAPELTGGKIQAIHERAVDILRKRGIVP